MAAKYQYIEDGKSGKATSVKVKVFRGDFLGFKSHPEGSPFKTYVGKAYSYNKRSGLMTILSPKGKGYRVIQAPMENVSKCRKQSNEPFRKGEFVV